MSNPPVAAPHLAGFSKLTAGKLQSMRAAEKAAYIPQVSQRNPEPHVGLFA